MYSSQQLLISGNLGVDASIVYLEKSICEFNERFTFRNNYGSFMAINSWIAFQGHTRFQDCSYPHDYITVENGGAITTIYSTTYFNGKAEIIGNHAKRKGGAIHATGSIVHMVSEITIADNIADDSGGGVYLFQSKLNCIHKCTFSGNTAMKSGGAIYAIASTVYGNDEQVDIRSTSRISRSGQTPVMNYRYSTNFSYVMLTALIIFTDNDAKMGGALAFEMNSKLYGSSSYKIIFKSNSADYGRAVYINDYTNSGTCASRSYLAYSASTECFIKTLNYHNVRRMYIDKRHYQFVDNFAAKSGPSMYGGLLDRCTVSPITDLLFKYLDNITSSVIVTPTHHSGAARNTQEDI